MALALALALVIAMDSHGAAGRQTASHRSIRGSVVVLKRDAGECIGLPILHIVCRPKVRNVWNEEARAQLVNEAPTSLFLCLADFFVLRRPLRNHLSHELPFVERVSKPAFAISYPALPPSTPPFVSHNS
jgi:hypothetical protein